MPQPYAIHWFRRDLRLRGNSALTSSLNAFDGRVVGLFCFDKAFLSREDFSVNRFQFFLETLTCLKEELISAGGDLLCLDTGPDEAFEKVLSLVSNRPSQVSWNRDYEPFARARDARMEKWFQSKGVRTFTERDHLLIEPTEVVKRSDPSKPFQVFTPFSRAWLELFSTPGVQSRLHHEKQKRFALVWKDVFPTKSLPQDVLSAYLNSNRKKVSIALPKGGTQEADKKLKKFASKIFDYEKSRDIPSLAGTSQLSIYFKNGSLTLPQVISKLELPGKNKSSKKYLTELIWREFYYYILYHFPHVEKESFNPLYKNLKWENKETHFEAWKNGETGYPIVDAGMRQLKQTGWMHNRVRMVVASFLTKDLLVDWRWGEKYFMEQLLDGDLAPNNGGWQWSASTGCDPQPYFRIFNPQLQSRKFDPAGKYIRQWVPELRDLKDREIHAPPPLRNYPRPIVDHSAQREKALALFKAARAL